MNNLYRALAATAMPNQELTVDLVPDLIQVIQDGDYAVASLFWGQAWDELELLSKVRRWVTDREQALCQVLAEASAQVAFGDRQLTRAELLRRQRETASATVPAGLLTPPDGKQALLELLQLGVAAQLVFSQSSRAGSPEQNPTPPTKDDPAQDTPSGKVLAPTNNLRGLDQAEEVEHV